MTSDLDMFNLLQKWGNLQVVGNLVSGFTRFVTYQTRRNVGSSDREGDENPMGNAIEKSRKV